jgi:phenylalanyl-tRNA synthetase beta chain
MLVPLSWLKDYVDIDVEPKELESKLFSCGFEVEELYQVGKDISGVVVGLVEECEPIPETHLHLCKINVGEEELLQICCGADNVHAGGKYPVALVGAKVYMTAKDHVTIEGVMTIKKGKLRGYESFGMLCSGTELGINEDRYPGAGYNGLLVLPENAKIGADVKPIVGLDDWIFDISITANRPDCQSIFGIAREVAAVLNKEIKMPALDYTESGTQKEGFTVSVEAPDLCPRYIAHYVTDVKIGESPAWMKRRLSLVGINSISNIVDITNYILKELGQPMHAFDSSYLQGNSITVRRAKENEKIVTLDEKEFTLNPSNLVICDGVKPVALAGIMGGLNSEIRDTTKAVVFESAKFARDNIRKSSRALGQSSDSSARYAKGVDEYATVMAMKRALHLIDELGCGKVSSTHVEVSTGNSVEPTEMKASIKKVNHVLGIEVPAADIERILKALQFAPSIKGDELTIQVPAYREDMDSYPDIAEEVIRMYGYEHVTPTFLKTAAVTAGGMNTKQKIEMKLKRALCAEGVYEGMHYSFFSPADLDLLGLPEDAPERRAIRLMNPINEDLSLMRTTLVPQMIHAIANNQKRNRLEGRIFEIGSKFIPNQLPITEYPDERQTLCVGLWGKEESFFTLKGIAETVAETLYLSFAYEADQKPFLHPYQCAKILFEEKEIGYLGTLTYEIQKEEDMREAAYLMEIDLQALSDAYGKVPSFNPISKYAEESRDLALVMDKEVTCGQVEDVIKESCAFVKDVTLFDVYEGKQIDKDKKSMAFSVLFVPKDEEFTSESVDAFVKKILKNLRNKLNIDLRS